ncbi:phosphonoacetaldehyde hydrolase [Marinomonas rhizomae]|uniref:Phosphonoacetaldehyde hydrolase n=1 Tax=Marinomonas rhizomae TaxID=491948 RepID=A0A366IWU5_9GAMM|nr:phosphonoacetaldehyde hydrolase [Marinomonas rhizomae]RBP79037.1 phosphonoacetaldehyde hydrolase [Marinomonas rhizomae]RNF71261.1 phosphonoacetaldehyde hydrolase [Marinomonas rhizomae]
MSKVQAVIFDWAGTMLDFGSFAPTSIFVEAFKSGFDFDVSLAEARVPMGLSKIDHIREVGKIPAVDARWRAQHGHSMTEEEVVTIYKLFMPLQIAKVCDHAIAIPGAVDVLKELRSSNIKVGSCTGYPREVLDKLLPTAADIGIAPDYVVASDDLPQGGRPGPFMALKNVIELGVTNVSECIKVDDSAPGIAEGLNGGMWTVALLLSGNEAGLTQAEFESLDEAGLEAARSKARQVFADSGAHFMIDTIADLPGVIAEVEARLAQGIKP